MLGLISRNRLVCNAFGGVEQGNVMAPVSRQRGIGDGGNRSVLRASVGEDVKVEIALHEQTPVALAAAEAGCQAFGRRCQIPDRRNRA